LVGYRDGWTRVIIDEMQRRLADEIEGARVSPFITAGLSSTRWP
jgi:hypothetical protein